MHGNTKHGHYRGSTQTPTVNTWVSMLKRCCDPSNKNYGGRGITVDSRWLDFSNFLSDMGERPNGYTLDRIDPDLGYFKDNCRWSCAAKQQHNRRDNKLSWDKIERIKWMRSEGFTHKQIAAEFDVAQSTITRVLNGKRWKTEQIVIKPGDDTPRKALP